MSKHWKKGIASFYIVAISTLIMVVVATSFSAIIISEVTRSSNDDLSQSAYDAALAGLEDAKLAYSNYQRCLEKGKNEAVPDGDGSVNCGEIIYWVNHPDCDMVGRILGRIEENEENEVLVQDTVDANGTRTNQAYTCNIIQTNLADYAATITSSNPVRVVKLQFGDETVPADSVEAIKFSWYSVSDSDTTLNNALSNGEVAFTSKDSTTAVAVPPMVELRIVQTGKNGFKLNSDDGNAVNGKASGDKTDRATLYLVPAVKEFLEGIANASKLTALNGSSCESGKKPGDVECKIDSDKKSIRAFDNSDNITNNTINAAQVASTNNRGKNLPFLVGCSTGGIANGYACSTMIYIPKPLEGGGRSDDTFMFMVSLPYGEPNTDFAIEICKNNDGGALACSADSVSEEDGSSKITDIYNSQVRIDVTGRANDVYRRIATRLETQDAAFPYPFYAIEALDEGDDKAITKADMTVRCEWDLYDGLSNPSQPSVGTSCPTYEVSN